MSWAQNPGVGVCSLTIFFANYFSNSYCYTTKIGGNGNKLLQKDPAKRPSASEALSHPWLVNMQGLEGIAVPNLTESVGRLKEFRAETRLRQASRTYMINYT